MHKPDASHYSKNQTCFTPLTYLYLLPILGMQAGLFIEQHKLGTRLAIFQVKLL